ncbi:MAG: MFS transporter [Herbinix sp.]|nr:MFS transporter [Herbinix sp.]
MKLNNSKKLGITLLLANAFVYIAFSLYNPFLSSYYSKAGLNALQIGTLLTIGPLFAIFIQPFWAILSDKTGRRKDILSLLVVGSGISMLSFYIGHSFLTFLIAASLLAIFCTSIFPLNDAITLRYANRYQLDFSRIRMGGTIGFATFVVIAGAIIKQYPTLLFLMGFFGYFVLLIFIRILPEDEKVSSSDTKEGTISVPLKEKKTGLLHIFESKQIYFMLGFAFISQVGLSFNGCFIGVYMINLGLNESMIGIINCICALSEIPVLFIINRVLCKISTTKVIIFSSLLLGFRLFLITGGNIGFIIAAQALQGLTYMTIYFSCAVFISKNVKPENQSKGQSALTIVQTGFGSIVGNIAGGYFVDKFGLIIAYRFIAVIVIIVSLLIGSLLLYYLRISKTRNAIS